MMPREFFPSRRPTQRPWSLISLLALTLVVCPSDLRASDGTASPNYVMATWASEKGLPPGDVFAVAQDVEGYLWLGTPTGLLRFDGHYFTTWEPAEGSAPLPNGPVHAIVPAQEGGIWVGLGGGGGVVRIHRGEIVRHLPADGAPPGVTALMQDRHGALWVAARRGIFTFANGRWTAMGKAEGYGGAEAFSLYEDRAGHMWVGTGTGVYLTTKDGF